MIENIKISTQEAIEYRDQPLALEVLTYIQKNNINDIDSKSLQKLAYVRLSSLSLLKASILLKESLLVAYEIPDYILSERLIQYIEQIELVTDMIEFTDRLDTILNEHKEVLGSQTVGKWLNDYAGTPQNKRDAFSQTRYLNTSSQAKLLSKEQRLVLADLLKIFDYVNYIMVFWQLLDQMPKEEILKQVNPNESWRDLLPGIIQGNTVSVDSSAPAPQQPKPQVKLPEFDAARPTPSPTLNENKYVPPAPAPQQPKPRMNVPNQYTANPGKIHDLINQKPKQKMGVVMDPTNVRLEEEKRRLDRDRDDQADMIQFKLAELRKRNKTEEDENSQTK